MSESNVRQPLISVVVVNWNGKKFLDDCLRSVVQQTWPNIEIVVVDNGSTDGSTEIVREWALRQPNLVPIYLNKNTGFTKGNNIALTRLRGEWVALLNNDAVATPDWLVELIRLGDYARRVGMVGSKILFADPPGMIDKVGHLIYWDGQNRGRGTMERDDGQYDREEEILWPDACAALYHRELLKETGGFDETFFAYGDDADLGMRARLLGWSARFAPRAVVHHRHSATAGAYSPLKVMLVERNRILLAVKNFPLRLLILNPYWTLRRYAWHARSVLGRQGSAGRFVAEYGRFRPLLNLAWSYLSALKKLPGALVRRWKIQRSRRLSSREVIALLHRYHIDVRELTLRD